MAIKPAVGDRYLVTWKELGEPTLPGQVTLPGLGVLMLDDADIHYAIHTPDAAFFIRESKVIGEGVFVTVSRRHRA